MRSQIITSWNRELKQEEMAIEELRNEKFDKVFFELLNNGFEGNSRYEEYYQDYLQTTETLTLKSHQIDIFNHFQERIRHNKIMIDISELGCGKSYVMMKLALVNNFTVLYISNDLAVLTMNSLMKLYGVRHVKSLTFSDLTSIGNRTSNPYINNNNGTYQITDNYRNILISRPIFVVIDEIQAGKNNDALRSDAIRLLLNPIYFPRSYNYPETNSRIALLSGTLFDKKKHASQMIYLTNFCGSMPQYSSLYHDHGKGMINYMNAGFGELVHNCSLVNRQVTSDIVGGLVINEGGFLVDIGNNFNLISCIEMTYELFVKIILPYYSYGISKPPCPHKKNAFNLVKNVSVDQEHRMNAFLQKNQRCFKLVPSKRYANTFEIEYSNRTSKFQSECLELIQMFKAEIIVEEALRDINMGRKVIIFSEFNSSTDYIYRGLTSRGHRILKITGEIKRTDERFESIHLFNNDPSVKGIVCKRSIASSSINLHCTRTLEEGGEVRSLYMIPSWDLTQIIQALDRVDRVDRSTEVFINICWVMSQSNYFIQALESALFNNLRDKIEVLRQVSRLQELGITREFFTDYPYRN